MPSLLITAAIAISLAVVLAVLLTCIVDVAHVRVRSFSGKVALGPFVPVLGHIPAVVSAGNLSLFLLQISRTVPGRLCMFLFGPPAGYMVRDPELTKYANFSS